MQNEFVTVQHDIFALSQKGKDEKSTSSPPKKKNEFLSLHSLWKDSWWNLECSGKKIDAFARLAKINHFSTVVTNSDRKPKIRRVSGTRCLASKPDFFWTFKLTMATSTASGLEWERSQSRRSVWSLARPRVSLRYLSSKQMFSTVVPCKRGAGGEHHCKNPRSSAGSSFGPSANRKAGW